MGRQSRRLPPKREVPLLEEVTKEKIEFDFRKRRVFRRWYRLYMLTMLTAFLLVLAVLIVGFGRDGGPLEVLSSISQMLFGSSGGQEGQDSSDREVLDGFLLPDRTQNGDTDFVPDLPVSGTPPLTFETLYQFDYSAVPTGQIPILPMDLSLVSYGSSYIHNLTGLTPDTEALLGGDLKKEEGMEYLSALSGPQVLIVHTHATESYSPDGAISCADDGGELARSSDPSESVVAVGEILADELNRAGISTLHCTVMHDQVQYKDSYARAEETIRKYLAQYPSIRLVIDVHRDSILKSSGELVRPVTLVEGEAAAQVMCVVGSNWGGDENPNWEGNLALALKLREALNSKHGNLCRPPYLKSSTYNQELAPYSLLLEIGASGNSLVEAQRAARAVAEELAVLIRGM